MQQKEPQKRNAAQRLTAVLCCEAVAALSNDLERELRGVTQQPLVDERVRLGQEDALAIVAPVRRGFGIRILHITFVDVLPEKVERSEELGAARGVPIE